MESLYGIIKQGGKEFNLQLYYYTMRIQNLRSSLSVLLHKSSVGVAAFYLLRVPTYILLPTCSCGCVMNVIMYI